MAEEKSAYEKLNPKQRSFVDAFCGEARGNATRAAEQAGYAHAMQQGSRLRNTPAIDAAIEESLAELRAQIRARGIAVVETRVAALDARWDLLEQVRQERAAEPNMQAVPGGKTGLLVRKGKLVKCYTPVQLANPTAEEGEICPRCVERYEEAEDAPRLRHTVVLHPLNGDEQEKLLCPECVDRWLDTETLASAKLSETIYEYELDGRLLSEFRDIERQAAQELGQWRDRKEHSGPNGGPIEVAFDLTNLSDEELEEFERLARKADPDAGGDPG